MPSYHDLKIGETLHLVGSGQVEVTLIAKSGRRARLAIEADAAVAIQPRPAGAEPGLLVLLDGASQLQEPGGPGGPHTKA